MKSRRDRSGSGLRQWVTITVAVLIIALLLLRLYGFVHAHGRHLAAVNLAGSASF